MTPMPLPDLGPLLMLCTQDPRCRGLIAFGPAMRDYAPPEAPLDLLLIADDLELALALDPTTDHFDPEHGRPAITVHACTFAQFADACEDPASTRWFLALGEGVILFDADDSLATLMKQALDWTPVRRTRAQLTRTAELIRHLDTVERALEDADGPLALQALHEALSAQRRLELLAAERHPGSSFWGAEIGHGIAAAHYFTLIRPEGAGQDALAGIAEELALALDTALAACFPVFARALTDYPEGLPLEDLGHDPALTGIPGWDLLVWRQHQRGLLRVAAEQRELPGLPGHFSTGLRVQLVEEE